MNHWPFIIASYALTFLGVGGLAIGSLLAMRRAEAEAARLGRRE
jgi:heme exporter protein CcmD